MSRTTRTFMSLALLGFAIGAGRQSIAQEGRIPQSPPNRDPSQSRPGYLGLPLNTPVVLEGVVIEGNSKGFEGGPNVVVQRIDGRATQEFVRIKLSGQIEKPRPKADAGIRSIEWVFKMGHTYRIHGHEHGAFVGGGENIRPPVQTTARYFQHLFEVRQYLEIEPIQFDPADFLNRDVLLHGTALHVEGRPYLVGNGWLVAAPVSRWPAEFVGRKVEGFGKLRASRESGLFEINDATTRLVHLRDQIGRKVSLRGTAWSMNGEWWFDYRGKGIHIDKMISLPGWNAENHGREMQIDGLLEVANLPNPVYHLKDSEPKLAQRFIVRQASWKPIESLLTPERGDLFEN